MTNLLALPAGTELAGDFRIERVLGAGGFGITYLAEETPLARRVTIKEYFPADFAARDGDIEATPRSRDCADDYKWGLDRFLEEAQTLAKFDHPNIVRVYRYFRANNTGYIVLHFEEGQSFKSWLKSLGRAPRQAELDQIVTPLLDALELIHNADFLHRDIAPDNIIIRKDGSPVLIDFGSARGEIAQHSMTVSALVKPGYSPYEQYATNARQQGPWSDIYSLGATLYQAVTNKRPPDAPTRMVSDELVPARDAALSAYRPGFLGAIDKALALEVTGRPKTVAIWRKKLLEAPAAPKPAAERAAASPKKAAEAPASAPRKAKPAGAPAPTVAVTAPWLRNVASALKWRPNAKKEAAPKPAADVIALPAPVPAKATTAPKKRRTSPSRSFPFFRAKKRSTWRPLAIKLLIGLGVASVAVALQDRYPGLQSQGANVLGLASETGPSQLRGHRGPVSGVAFAAGGQWLVTGSLDGTLKVWNPTTRALLRSFELGSGPASALAAEGRRAVLGHKDGTVALWDLESGEKLASFKHSDTSIWSVTFAGDADRFAAASRDWAVSLYDAKSPAAPVHVFEGHENTVRTLAYSAISSVLASAGADRTIRLWNATAYAPMRVYRAQTDFAAALALSADGGMLASGGIDGAIRLWLTADDQPFRTLRGHGSRISALAFSPDSESIVSASTDGTLKIWSLKDSGTPRTLLGHDADILSISFSPDGRRLATGGGDGIVRIWELAASRPAS
jgi:serine/threonine protein kinase